MELPKNLFSFKEEHEDKFIVNLDLPEVLPFVPDKLTHPDLLSLFYHNTENIIVRDGTSMESDLQCRRYFADTLICYECGQTGHTNKRCPQLVSDVCVLCAMKGHRRHECPMRICLNCNMCGHMSKECRERPNQFRRSICRQCVGGEHTSNDCPLIWREYIITGDIDKRKIQKACCLCFSTKHYVDDCAKTRTRFSIFNSNFLSNIKIIKK